jgi:hypothetical protein
MVERESKRRESVNSYPPVLTDEERSEYFNAIVAPAQKQERDNIGRDVVEIKLLTNNPIILICISDLHIGSVATDYEAIKEIFDFAMKTKNAKVALLGDEIEGTKEKYMNTNVARILGDTESQKNELVKYLRPLVAADKLAFMVSGYWGHSGWEEDAATTNPWLDMADRIGLDHERVLKNGGRADFVFPNGCVHSDTIWHNPPGKSKYDTVYGLRNAAFATSESNRTDGYMSAHTHKMGVGKELYSDAKKAIYYISSGTAKGSSKEVPPDRFGVKLGAPPTDPLGQGSVIRAEKRGHKTESYPFATLKHGKKVNESLDLLDWTEKNQMTAELLEKIRTEVEKKPKITLVAGKSGVSGDAWTENTPVDSIKLGGELVTNPYSKMTMRAPYDSLTYNIETKLPVTLHFLNGARLGSSSEGFDELKKYQNELIADNPHSLVLFLRSMIDQESGKSPQRMEILDRLKRVIEGSKEQTLAILMCESLRSNAWRKKIATGEIEEVETGRFDKDGNPKMKTRNIYSMPMAPGSYLATETDTPLIHHLSLINLIIGPKGPMKDKPWYSGRIADEEMRHASYSRPEYGLRRLYDLYIQEKAGFVVGGHMPNAGSMMFYDGSNPETKTPILIAPGWFSKYADTTGKGNIMHGAPPGQAIIFMPGSSKEDYFAHPTNSVSETGDMQNAFTLMTGLEILGLTDQVLSRRRK